MDSRLGLIYTAGFLPPENNPFMDQHIIFALVLLGMALTRMDSRLGFGVLVDQFLYHMRPVHLRATLSDLDSAPSVGQLQPGEEVPHPLMTSFMPYKNGFAQALGLWVYSSPSPSSLF